MPLVTRPYRAKEGSKPTGLSKAPVCILQTQRQIVDMLQSGNADNTVKTIVQYGWNVFGPAAGNEIITGKIVLCDGV